MEAKMKLAGSTLVVRMVGELDHHAVDGLRNKIDRKLSEQQIRNILFDFKGVNFMDSSGLGLVLGRYRIVTEKGGRVMACCLSPRVQRVFEMSGLQSRIPVYQSEQDALLTV